MGLGWTTGKYSTTYRAVKTVRINGNNKAQIGRAQKLVEAGEKTINRKSRMTLNVLQKQTTLQSSIVKANKRCWEIEECFRNMKTDFEARPVYLNRQDRILDHFIIA